MYRAPSLVELGPQRLKRANSASSEKSLAKRTVFGQEAYVDILYQVAGAFAGRLTTCTDPREATYWHRFDGVNPYGQLWGGVYYIELKAKLVPAGTYAPVSAEQAPGKALFRLTMRLWNAHKQDYLPIWEQLGAVKPRPLPLEVHVPCGMTRPEMENQLVDALNPWLTFLHYNYGLAGLPRNTPLLVPVVRAQR